MEIIYALQMVIHHQHAQMERDAMVLANGLVYFIAINLLGHGVAVA